MFCSSCGKENPDGMNFCKYCGKPLETGGINKTESAIDTVQIDAKKTDKEDKSDKSNATHAGRMIPFLVVELLLFCGLIFAFFKLGGFLYGPEETAKRFMLSYGEGNTDAAMSLLDTEGMEESDSPEFLNGNSLKSIIPNEYEAFEITDISQKENSAVVKVKYGSENDLSEKLKLDLKKQKRKSFYFFDTWKVSTDEFIVRDVEIKLPYGTEGYIDGVLINRTYIDDGTRREADNEKQEVASLAGLFGNIAVPAMEAAPAAEAVAIPGDTVGAEAAAPAEDDAAAYILGSDSYEFHLSDGSFPGYETYLIPELYSGEHIITAALEGYPVSSEKIIIDAENSHVTLSNITLPEKLQKDVVETAYQYAESCIDSKIKGRSFDTIEKLYFPDSGIIDAERSKYESVADEYYLYNGNNGITSIKLKKTHGEVADCYVSDGPLRAEVRIEGNVTRKTKDWYGDENKESFDGTVVVYMVYDADGSWKLSGLNAGWE